jgi:oxygen-dependent protoporphyrinogen oxidase
MSGADRVDVAVVGAGISGLACAFFCRSLGMSVAVFESASEPGGCIKTVHAHGCVVEGGPQSLMSSPALSELIDGVGIRGDVVASAPAAKRRYVLTHAGLVPVPASPPALLMSRLISTGGKWRLMREPFVAKRTAESDESVASFVRRRAGAEIADTVAAPYVAGINAGDSEQISVRSAFPALEKMEREHGSVLRALRASGIPKARPQSFSFSRGNQVLPLALAASLGDAVALRSPAERIELTSPGVTLHVGGDRQRVVRADSVVVCSEGAAAARLIEPLSVTAARELAAIESAPVVQIALVYPRAAIGVPFDGFGFLASRSAAVRILGAVWSSVAFPDRCAESDMLVTVFIGGAIDRGLTAKSDDELVTIAHADLCRAMKIQGANPRVIAILRSRIGIPQYTLGHDARVRAIEEAMSRVPAVTFCGNSLHGVSVSDCVRQAREIARQIARASGTAEGT